MNSDHLGSSDNKGPKTPEPSARDWQAFAEWAEHIDLIRWAYGKLHHVSFTKQEDALMLDRMKLLLEHGVQS